MKPVVAVCIRTYSGTYQGRRYNRLEFLQRNIRSLVKNTVIPHTITVIDDASQMDDQKRYLKRLEKQGVIHHLVIKPRNLGRQHSFAMQRRLGLKTGAPFIYICDDDYEYRPEWLSTLVSAYEVLRGSWRGRPVGLLSGFNREGADYDSTHRFKGYKFGLTTNWIGCRWLMSREVLQNGGRLGLAPAKNWPRQWTSPWIDDGSYQLELTSKHGYESAFVLDERPSLVEHIGSIGVHAKPGKYVKGVK